MRIDFLGLQAFVAIAEHGSFQHAAVHLNLSQTALSHRIRKLEDDLGVKLLSRTTREVTMTQAGIELLPEVKSTIAHLSDSLENIRGESRGREEHLSIGCLPTVASAYLPIALRRFRYKHPEIVVRIYDHSASTINDLLEAGTIAFGINMVTTHRWDFDVEPLSKDAFCLVCPDSHPLADLDSISWSDLSGHPLIRVGQQTGNRILLDDVLGSRRENLCWRYEVQHLQTALAMVRHGDALSIMPRMAFDSGDDRGLKCLLLKNPSVTRQIGIVTKRGTPLSTLADALRREVVAAMNVAG